MIRQGATLVVHFALKGVFIPERVNAVTMVDDQRTQKDPDSTLKGFNATKQCFSPAKQGFNASLSVAKWDVTLQNT